MRSGSAVNQRRWGGTYLGTSADCGSECGRDAESAECRRCPLTLAYDMGDEVPIFRFISGIVRVGIFIGNFGVKIVRFGNFGVRVVRSRILGVRVVRIRIVGVGVIGIRIFRVGICGAGNLGIGV